MKKEGGDYQTVNREEVEEQTQKQANQQAASDFNHRRSFIQVLLDCFRIFFQRLCEFFICRTKARKEDLSQKEDLLKNESPKPKEEEENLDVKCTSSLSEPGQDDTTAKTDNRITADDIVKYEHLAPIASDAHIPKISPDKVVLKTSDKARPDSTNVETVETTEDSPRDGSPRGGWPRDEKNMQEQSLHKESVTDVQKIPETSELRAQSGPFVHNQDTIATPLIETQEKEPSELGTESFNKKDECESLQQKHIENSKPQDRNWYVDKSSVFVASTEGQIVEDVRPSDWGEGQPDVMLTKPRRFSQPGVRGVFFADNRGYAEELPRPPEWGPEPEDPNKRVVKFQDAAWAVAPCQVKAVIPSTNVGVEDVAQIDNQESSAYGNQEADQEVVFSQLATSAKDREEIIHQEKDRFLDKSGIFVVRDDGQTLEEPRPNNWGEAKPDVVITKPRRPSQPTTPGVHGVFFADNHGYAEELPRPPEWGPEPEDLNKRLVKFEDSSWAVAPRPAAAIIPSSSLTQTDVALAGDVEVSTIVSDAQEAASSDTRKVTSLTLNELMTSAKDKEEIDQQQKDRFLDKSGIFVVMDDGQTIEEPRPKDWSEGQPAVMITKPKRPFRPGTPGVRGVFYADNRGYAEELPRPPEWGPEPEDPTKRLVKFEDSSWAVAPRPAAAIIPSSSSKRTVFASAGENLEASTEVSDVQEVSSSDSRKVILNDDEVNTSAKDQEEIDLQEKDRFLDKSGVFVVRDDGQTLEEPRPNDWGEGQPDMGVIKPRRPSQPATPGVRGVFFADNCGYAEELPRPPEWGPEPEDPTKSMVKFKDSLWAVAPRQVAAIIPSSPLGICECRASQPGDASLRFADKEEVCEVPHVTAEVPDVTSALASKIKAENERAATIDEPDGIEVEHQGVAKVQDMEAHFQTAGAAHPGIIEEATSGDLPTDITDEIVDSKDHAHAAPHLSSRARDKTVKTAHEEETERATDCYAIDASGDHEGHLEDGENMLHTTVKEQTEQREKTPEGDQTAGAREAASSLPEWYSPERNPFEGQGVLVDRINKATIPEKLQHRECTADGEVLLSEHVHGTYSFQRDF